MSDTSTSVPSVKPAKPATWTEGIQTGLAWTVIIVFAVLVLALAARVIISSAADDSLELLKQAANALINIVMVVMGYFFGSSKSAQGKDDVIGKIALEPPPAPIAPAPVTTTTEIRADGSQITKTEPAPAAPGNT